MTGAVLQPCFLPWRGFFDLVRRSDVFVVLDDVQYDKHSWRNRNRIKTAQGVKWITVPVETRGRAEQKILETRICHRTPWRRKILKAIEQSYAKAPFFSRYFGAFSRILEKEWDLLTELDVALMREVMSFLGLKTPILRSSELDVRTEDKNERLLRLCRRVGIDRYLTGPAAKDYLDDTVFGKEGIGVDYMTYDYPPYEQLHGPFEPKVSIIDLLFQKGPEAPRFIWSD